MNTEQIAHHVELAAKKFAASQHVSRHVVDAMGVEAAASLFGEDLAFMLKAYVYGTNGRGRYVVERQVPASWWQHFKASAIRDGNPFFRHVKTKRETVTVTADLFSWWPDMDLQVPEKWGDPVRLVTFARAEWDES